MLMKDAESFLSRLRPGQMLEALFDAVPEAYLFIKDRESRFVSASKSFARMLGASSVEEIIGKTDFDYSANFMAEVFVADDRRVMITKQNMVNKIELVPTGDSLDWLSTTKIPLYDNDGNVVGLAGICHVILGSDELYRNHPEMRRIVAFIQSNFRKKITAADIARAAEISVSSLERLFRATVRVTPRMYLCKTRLNAACRMLREGIASLTVISEQCGFNDQTGMTRAFRQELKITPMKYRLRFSNGVTAAQN